METVQEAGWISSFDRNGDDASCEFTDHGHRMIQEVFAASSAGGMLNAAEMSPFYEIVKLLEYTSSGDLIGERRRNTHRG